MKKTKEDDGCMKFRNPYSKPGDENYPYYKDCAQKKQKEEQCRSTNDPYTNGNYTSCFQKKQKEEACQKIKKPFTNKYYTSCAEKKEAECRFTNDPYSSGNYTSCAQKKQKEEQCRSTNDPYSSGNYTSCAEKKKKEDACQRIRKPYTNENYTSCAQKKEAERITDQREEEEEDAKLIDNPDGGKYTSCFHKYKNRRDRIKAAISFGYKPKTETWKSDKCILNYKKIKNNNDCKGDGMKWEDNKCMLIGKLVGQDKCNGDDREWDSTTEQCILKYKTFFGKTKNIETSTDCTYKTSSIGVKWDSDNNKCILHDRWIGYGDDCEGSVDTNLKYGKNIYMIVITLVIVNVF